MVSPLKDCLGFVIAPTSLRCDLSARSCVLHRALQRLDEVLVVMDRFFKGGHKLGIVPDYLDWKRVEKLTACFAQNDHLLDIALGRGLADAAVKISQAFSFFCHTCDLVMDIVDGRMALLS